MVRNTCIFLLFLVMQISKASAQNEDGLYFSTAPIGEEERSWLSFLHVGVKLSTMGAGVEFATPINQHFDLRAGINYLPYQRKNYTLTLENNGINNLNSAYGYTPNYLLNAKLKFINTNILVDWYPLKKSIYHLTAGFYSGNSNIHTDGFLVDRSTHQPSTLQPGAEAPKVIFDQHEVQAGDDASLIIDVKYKNIIKPYIGAGLETALAEDSRFGFKLDIGVLYQGKYAIYQNGTKIESNPTLTADNYKDFKKYTNIMKLWPMLSVQFTYDLF